MLDINKTLAQELNINSQSIKNALELLNGGATIPFVARYRKEYTNSLDETQLRNIWDRFIYLQELEERKKVIIKAINDAGKLTDELQEKIDLCLQKTELEDLYLPYKPKRRTRATIAREKGLESLADFIKSLNNSQAKPTSIEQEAVKYIDEEKGVKNIEEAIQGASDILAESVAEKAELRSYIREYFLKSGCFSSKIKDDYPEGTTKFEMYRNFRVNVKDIAPHNMLALLRGESQGVLNLELDFDRDFVLSYLTDSEIKTRVKEVRSFYQEMLKDALNRLMKNSLINEVRGQKKAEADIESIKTFETNLKELLLSPPAGMKPTLGIDPGFRTGCK
ncbi:MAG: RNA-binding transcriptional accessory protein, partial [Okeania sp. SIO3H1]|nr:RNA-binding transcriptional accessory protein [Okeania sp. SIO3H1]